MSSIVSLIHIDDITAWLSLIVALFAFGALLFNIVKKLIEVIKKAREPASEGGKEITLGELLEILKSGEDGLNEAKKAYPQLSGAIDALAESIKKDETEVKK